VWVQNAWRNRLGQMALRSSYHGEFATTDFQGALREGRLAEYEVKYPGEEIPRPPFWSGFRVLPERFEFWQNMPFRLHDRTIYTRAANGGWTIGKLYP